MVRLPDLREEDGFTLIELMVVVVILGALLLMATSTYSGVKARAQDSAAKQTAARALETGRIVFTDGATYSTATPAELMAVAERLRRDDPERGTG
jgi:prepilin-type N-terminal cleavage/methylation domain-containing protein